MIELFPAKCRGEILHCSVWAGVVMNHHNTPAKHIALLILDRAVQFFKCVATDTGVDCGALRQKVHKQSAFSVPKHCAHDLPSWCGLLEFYLLLAMKCASTPWTAASIRGFMRHQCLVPCDYMAQGVFTFLTVLCQKLQCRGLLFQIVFFHKHLRHTVCTQFPKLNFTRHNLVKKWPWNLRKMQGKWCNGESSVVSNLLFNCKHQIFIHQRQFAAPHIMHIFVSFIKQLQPYPYHVTAHGIFSIQVTELTSFS